MKRKLIDIFQVVLGFIGATFCLGVLSALIRFVFETILFGWNVMGDFIYWSIIKMFGG